MRVVIENTVGRAHRHLAVALRIEDQSQTRRELRFAPEGCRLARIARVAGEAQSGGRVFIDRALCPCDKSRLIEVAHPAEGMFHGQVRIAAEAAPASPSAVSVAPMPRVKPLA